MKVCSVTILVLIALTVTEGSDTGKPSATIAWFQAWIHDLQSKTFPWAYFPTPPNADDRSKMNPTLKPDQKTSPPPPHLHSDELELLLCEDGPEVVMKLFKKQLRNSNFLWLLHPTLQTKLMDGLMELEGQCHQDDIANIEDVERKLWEKLFYKNGETIHDAVTMARIIELDSLEAIRPVLCNMEPKQFINDLIEQFAKHGYSEIVTNSIARQMIDILQRKQLHMCMNFVKGNIVDMSMAPLVKTSIILELLAHQVPVNIPAPEMMLPDKMKRPCIGTDCMVVEPPCEQTGTCQNRPATPKEPSMSTTPNQGTPPPTPKKPPMSTSPTKATPTSSPEKASMTTSSPKATPPISTSRKTTFGPKETPSTNMYKTTFELKETTPTQVKTNSSVEIAPPTTSPKTAVESTTEKTSPSPTPSDNTIGGEKTGDKDEKGEGNTPATPKSKKTDRESRLLRKIRLLLGYY